jgi:hypothetical protein
MILGAYVTIKARNRRTLTNTSAGHCVCQVGRRGMRAFPSRGG